MSDETKLVKERHEFCVEVPGFAHQILVMAMAHIRGIKATIPGRSRRKVVLSGTTSEVQGVIQEASKLGLVHELNVLQALERLLLDHQLQVPLKLAMALSMAEFKVAFALGKVQKKPVAPLGGAVNRASDSFGSGQVHKN